MALFFRVSSARRGNESCLYFGRVPSLRHVELNVPIVDWSTAPQLFLWPSYATGVPPIECSELPSIITQTP